MPNCAVAKCTNCNQSTKQTHIKYLSFPKKEDLAKQWIAACGRQGKINLKNACVCSIHFEASCFEIPLRQRLLNYTPKNARNLKPDAVPTLHLPAKSSVKYLHERTKRFCVRRREPDIKEIVECPLSEPFPSKSQSVKDRTDVVNERDTDKDPFSVVGQNYEEYEKEIANLRERIEILQTENAEQAAAIIALQESNDLHIKNTLSIFTSRRISQRSINKYQYSYKPNNDRLFIWADLNKTHIWRCIMKSHIGRYMSTCFFMSRYINKKQ